MAEDTVPAATPTAAQASLQSDGNKVVVHFSDRIVKGFIHRGNSTERPRPGLIRVMRLDGVLEEVSLVQTQGVYFVKEFEEDTQHQNILFFNMEPMERLWARLVFKDGKTIEGMIENGPQVMLSPGFLVTPTDPTGNNRMIFVMKSQIRDFKVLGLRSTRKNTGVTL